MTRSADRFHAAHEAARSAVDATWGVLLRILIEVLSLGIAIVAAIVIGVLT